MTSQAKRLYSRGQAQQVRFSVQAACKHSLPVYVRAGVRATLLVVKKNTKSEIWNEQNKTKQNFTWTLLKQLRTQGK